MAPRTIPGYGWVPDLPDDRDRLFTAPPEVLAALPPAFDLRPKCPPVVDQSQLGSCTANAIASAVEFEMMRLGLVPYLPSRLFIYYEERRYLNTLASDSGAMIRDGIKVVHKLGAPPETDWPYVISQFTQPPPANAYSDAAKHKVASYQRLARDLPVLKSCIASGHPFVFGFTVYSSFESAAVAANGKMPMPVLKDEDMLGGHAVKAVGYDDNLATPNAGPGGFWVKNSWGLNWGDRGYFFMPYAYFTKRGLSSDFWTIRSAS